MITVRELIESDIDLKGKLHSSNYEIDELDEIIKDFQKRSEGLQRIADRYMSEALMMDSVHSVRSRIKKPKSLLEKLFRKENSTSGKVTLKNYGLAITDLVGIRLLYVYPSDWRNVYEQLKAKYEGKFAGKPEIKYREGDDLTVFGDAISSGIFKGEPGSLYRSVHYQIKENEVPDFIFGIEIQTRTIFEEGWSEVNHEMYKSSCKIDFTLQSLTHTLSQSTWVCDALAEIIKGVSEDKQTSIKLNKSDERFSALMNHFLLEAQ